MKALSLYALAIELNTVADHKASVDELARLNTRMGDDMFATPVSGDALCKVRKVGAVNAAAHITWGARA